MKYINFILSIILLVTVTWTTASAQINEGFEGTFPPDGWIILDNGNGTNQNWRKSQSEPMTGNAHAYVKYEDADGLPLEDWLVTPKLAPTGGNAQLTFYAKDDLSNNYNSRYSVRVSPFSQNDVTTFEEVLVFRETDLNNNDTYKQFSVDLSDYIGKEIYVAFVLENEDGDSFLLDDVSGPPAAPVTVAPNCNALLTHPANSTVEISIDTDLSWNAASGSPTGYKLSIGTFTGGTDILDAFDVGNTTTYTPANDLFYNTTYFVTIIPYNSIGDANTGDCQETRFSTRPDPNIYLDCFSGAASTNGILCYANDQVEEFTIFSNDATPVRITFDGGTVENQVDEIYVYDGTDDTGILLNDNELYGKSGDLTGLSYISISNALFIRLVSDGSNSCDSGDQTQISYTAACIDCIPPVATTSLSMCDGGTYEIDVNVTNLGNSVELSVSDDQASPAQTITNTGVVNFGPYNLGTAVTFTIASTGDAFCKTTLTSFTQAFCPPNNDDCSTPTMLNVSTDNNCDQMVSGTTKGASASAIDFPCESIITDDDVWFSVMPNTTGDYVFELSNLDFPSSLIVYDGTCGGILTNLTDCLNDRGQEIVNLTGNTTYLIQVFTNEEGVETDFDLCVFALPAPPTNDLCGGANLLDCNAGMISGIVADFATAQDARTCNNDDVGKGLWYKIMGNDLNLNLSVTPSGWDAELQIFTTPDCSSFTCERSMDDKGTGRTESINNFRITSGVEYFIYVGAYNQAALPGTFDLNVSCVTPLASELSNFRGIIKDNSNLIRWNIANEINIEKYVVERSADGLQNWLPIGTVAARNVAYQEYELEDNNPLENAYYRLQSISRAQSYEYSEIINIRRKNKDLLTVYPVPTTNNVRVEFHTLDEKEVELTLMDMLGRLVHQQKIETITGQNVIPFSMEKIDEGTYILILDDKTQRQTVRVVKQ